MSILGQLGTFAGQALGVYGGVQMAKYQQPVALTGITPGASFALAPGADSPFIPNALEFGLTGNQLAGDCSTKARTRRLNVTIDNATGEVVSVCPAKRRKRRRRLATCSDISDLIQLKATLGGGQALSSWIAKNGRC